MKVVVKSSLSSQWLPQEVIAEDRATLQIATDIHRRASVLAPKDTRALVNSGKINRIKSGEYEITFGGGRVPYARRRHYENKKNPQTLGYLERAGDGVYRSDSSKYMGSVK